jgi:hypothetical protein
MWIWFWGVMALAADVEIVVGGPGEVHVRSTSGSVHVPACRGVLWDRFNPSSGVFEPAQAPVCPGIKDAIRVDEKGRSFAIDVALPVLPDVGFHIVRPVIVYGSECSDKAPFPLAGCGGVQVVRGPQMVVRNRGAAVVLKPPETL